MIIELDSALRFAYAYANFRNVLQNYPAQEGHLNIRSKMFDV